MANVTVQGASYSDVPAVQLPQTGGGVCIFYEVTDGDNLSYGSAPLVGYAIVGCGLCTPLPYVGTAVVGDIL